MSLLDTCRELDLKEKIEKMSSSELKKNLYDALRIIKLMEEVGEISEGFLELVGYKKTSKPKKQILQNLKEEFVDAEIMVNVLQGRFDMDDKEKNEITNKKVGKWKNKYLDKNKKDIYIAIHEDDKDEKFSKKEIKKPKNKKVKEKKNGK